MFDRPPETAKITPAKIRIRWLRTSGKLPMGCLLVFPTEKRRTKGKKSKKKENKETPYGHHVCGACCINQRKPWPR